MYNAEGNERHFMLCTTFYVAGGTESFWLTNLLGILIERLQISELLKELSFYLNLGLKIRVKDWKIETQNSKIQ